MKVKYNLYLIHENMENDKLIGIKEGKVIYDYISKWDKILHDNLGSIEISGKISFLQDFIVLDDDYDENYGSASIESSDS